MQKRLQKTSYKLVTVSLAIASSFVDPKKNERYDKKNNTANE